MVSGRRGLSEVMAAPCRQETHSSLSEWGEEEAPSIWDLKV